MLFLPNIGLFCQTSKTLSGPKGPSGLEGPPGYFAEQTKLLRTNPFAGCRHHDGAGARAQSSQSRTASCLAIWIPEHLKAVRVRRVIVATLPKSQFITETIGKRSHKSELSPPAYSSDRN